MTVKKVKKTRISQGPGSRALGIVQKYFPGVTKIADARANVKVEVTKHDATVATRKAHKICAMAVACKRKLNLDGVLISMGTAYLVKGKKATRFHMTQRASREIVSFDRGSGFAAGEYELRRPGPSSRLGMRAGRTLSPSRNHESSGIRKRHLRTTGVRTALGSEVE